MIDRIHSIRACGALLLMGSATGCWTSPEPGVDSISVDLPEAWRDGAVDSDTDPEAAAVGLAESGTRWWTTFESPTLDAAVNDVLGSNLELSEAWSRLAQASASSWAAGAPRIPTLDLAASVQRQEIRQSGGGTAALPVRTGYVYNLGPSLSYEVDLFGRIDSALKAARLEEAATAADVQATALALTGRATDAWILAVQNRALSRLVRDQIGVGEQLLKVTENRFGTGSGSVLDVLQQKRQLQSTRAELPNFEGAAERAVHTLNTLSGRAPRDPELSGQDLPSTLPGLPPLPELDVPTALLTLRPDVVAALRRVERSDRNVASAIAARYPRLSLTASYRFDGSELSALFDRTFNNIVANLALPLLDGGTRRAEVARQRAILEGAIATLQRTILTALQEVEDALSREQRGVQRLHALEEQYTIASDELAQARRRYVGGVDTYLQVLSAVQNLQTLERQLLNDRAAVLQARAALLRALGGAWLDDLQPNP
ncbi:putative efflux pump outer membrane protein TtgC precursor [Planctomycetes bacterium Poly30]|uniref:Putative efflux pump outer membrane protein TtgC n=1 Tax=Saltatorellus ferox TaxID=2528018 RepID=A0A518ENX9_9BACT|nr:putative efflux pump outer membrane protein TtgC precursor [Planctomycetes bacterium Poly30]